MKWRGALWALGAGRFRLMRQVLAEALLLSAAGGLLAMVLAYFGAVALARIMTSGRFIGGPPQIKIAAVPDVHVLLFTGGIALLTGVLFGLAPPGAPLLRVRRQRYGKSGRRARRASRRAFRKEPGW
jgi:ABC-type antimicrobial peptide transport system permease subunit